MDNPMTTDGSANTVKMGWLSLRLGVQAAIKLLTHVNGRVKMCIWSAAEFNCLFLWRNCLDPNLEAAPFSSLKVNALFKEIYHLYS